MLTWILENTLLATAVAGFVAEAALKQALDIERASSVTGEQGASYAESVPSYFRACCEMARAGVVEMQSVTNAGGLVPNSLNVHQGPL